MPRDVVSWNSMLACYAQCGKPNEAPALLIKCGRKANQAIVVTSYRLVPIWALWIRVCICILISMIIELRSIPLLALHLWTCMRNVENFLATQVFNAMESKDVLAWNTIIAAWPYTPCQRSPTTFQGDERGAADYGIEPKVEHYDCVIDLLAVRGTMPMEPNPSALGALLGGCRIHGNFELAYIHMTNLFSNFSSTATSSSQTYMQQKKWDDARKVRNLMKQIRNVLLDMEEEDKEHALVVHSEKSAIAYGLLHLDSKEAIRIVKNLRVCRDCLWSRNYCKGSESVSSF
ncbi:hypothetical protein AAG906_017125 [Vitis piasezkii]